LIALAFLGLALAQDGDEAAPPVQVGGEVWFALATRGLQGTWVEGLDNPTPAFEVPRAHLSARAEIGDRIDAFTIVDFAQGLTTSTYAVDGVEESATVTVDDYPSGWRSFVKALNVTIGLDPRAVHRLRVGKGRTIFGLVDSLDGVDRYFLGGTTVMRDLAWRARLIARGDQGLVYTYAPSSAFSAQAMVANGTGGVLAEDNWGKDGVARLRWRPVEGLSLTASGQVGRQGEELENERRLTAASAEVGGRRARLIAEGLWGQVGEVGAPTPVGGFLVAAAQELPLGAARLDHLTFVQRYLAYDPDLEAPADDRWSSAAAGIWLHWATHTQRRFFTGASYQLDMVEAPEVDPAHEVMLQSTWSF